MSEYAIKYRDDETTHGPYSEGELKEKLEEYRGQHEADDPTFSRVSLWEMREGSTVGAERSVYDFIDEN